MQLQQSFQKWRRIFESSFPDLEEYSSIYKDLHKHPELPGQEIRTAATVAAHLTGLGLEVQTNIGGHGVVGILRNGSGKTIMLRSELDALPVKEKTGLPYTSQVQQVDADGYTKWVMHACGHDMHMVCLLAAAELLQNIRHHWSGTLICIFQPNEERFLGAQAMIDDGLFDKIPTPDILLAQHAVPTRAGTLGLRAGRVLGHLSSQEIRLYGTGTHSSTPESGIDPILLASTIIPRLQTIPTRIIGCKNPCVITVGSFHAGTDASVIPEHADFKVSIHSLDQNTQQTALHAVRRIIEAECLAAKCPRPPRIVTTAHCPPVDNDEVCTSLFKAALHDFYGEDDAHNDPPIITTPRKKKIISMDLDVTADDFARLTLPPGRERIPCVYWNLGVTPREIFDDAERQRKLGALPVNHSPFFAPEVGTSLRTGLEALGLAAVVFFGEKDQG
jgi:amidohydrolase